MVQGTVSPPGNFLSCLLGNIPLNGSATLTVTAVPTQNGTFSSYANDNAAEFDPNTGNNNAVQSTDVEAGPGVIQFTSALSTVNENAGVVHIGVMRTGGAISNVTVNFSTANLTA